MSTLAPSIESTGKGPRRWISLTWWNLNRSLIIARREVLDMFRDWRIIFPIVILTVIFPWIANWGAGRMFGFVNQYGGTLIGERLLPFLLMVVGFFPTSFSLIIALESFVGEKERKSLEPLLSTPVTDVQLYIGKMLSSTVPPIIGSLLGMGVYLFGVNSSINWSASPILFVQIFSLTVVQSLVMVAGAVVVSSQSTSVRAANLLASFIIIPMAFLIQVEAFVMFIANYFALWFILIGLIVVLMVLIRMGVRTFNREELLGRELDELNLGAILRSWWRKTWARTGNESRQPGWEWYRTQVIGQVWSLRIELLVITLCLVGAVYLGVQYADTYRFPEGMLRASEFGNRFDRIVGDLGFTGAKGISFVLLQNLRVLAIASVLATFSFGILIILIIMVPIALTSFLIVQLVRVGIDPVTVFATIIPHSLLEMPAAMIAAAAALRVGAVIIAPPPNKTVGDAWMDALAGATRLWFCLILPLLLVAAFIEVLVTPRLVVWLAGGG